MKNMMDVDEKKIFVYESSSGSSELLGILYVAMNNGREVFSFEYDDLWLKKSFATLSYDPDLQLYGGRQFLPQGKDIFEMFADASPDRWGRMLMQRREMLLAAQDKRRPKKLLESDYLLGVDDRARIGSLRFKLNETGEFLTKDEMATPPWVLLRKLEQASVIFENGEENNKKDWFNILVAPGSSLGGARPKATVQDEKGELWIAKFPSKHDEYDSGAWEMVVHDLAEMVGLQVPEAKLEKFSERGSTFLLKRFDREGSNRKHYASAMTVLGKTDGDVGTSYLDIAKFIMTYGSNAQDDLKELWQRVAFSMLVGNTDDHLRNHGFLLQNNGWQLSPMFDVNPVPYGDNLSLLVNETTSLIDKDILLGTADYYGWDGIKAEKRLQEMELTIKDNWQKLAKKYGIKRQAMETMKFAFRTSNFSI